MNTYKCKILKIGSTGLEELLTGKVFVKDRIPFDLKIVSCNMNGVGTIAVVVESSEFEELPEDAMIPEWNITLVRK